MENFKATNGVTILGFCPLETMAEFMENGAESCGAMARFTHGTNELMVERAINELFNSLGYESIDGCEPDYGDFDDGHYGFLVGADFMNKFYNKG